MRDAGFVARGSVSVIRVGVRSRFAPPSPLNKPICRISNPNRGCTTSSVKLKRPSAHSAWVTDSAPGVSHAGRRTRTRTTVRNTRGCGIPAPLPHMHGQCHADAAADVLLEPGRTREAFGRVHDLRKTLPARVEPGPDLAAGRHVLGDRDHARHMSVAADRERRADQPRRLRQQPTGRAGARLENFADIDHGAAVGEPPRKPAPDRERQRRPVGIRDQRAEAQVTERLIRSNPGSRAVPGSVSLPTSITLSSCLLAAG